MSKYINGQPYQAVFFDFDGVILDSVDVKTQAFAEIFRSYGLEVEKAAVDYHLANGGLSRYKKFEHIYQNVLKQPISASELKELGKKFSNLALQKVLKAPFMPGAKETLEELKVNSVPAFVVSGTPDEEIKYIVQKRGLSEYFREVHGSPRRKGEIVEDIMERYIFEPGKCLLIGDAIEDYEAAKKEKMHFLGIINCLKESIFPSDAFIKEVVDIKNLKALKPLSYKTFDGHTYIEGSYIFSDTPLIIYFEIKILPEEVCINEELQYSDMTPPMPLVAYPLAIYQVKNNMFKFQFKVRSGKQVINKYVEHTFKPKLWYKYNFSFDLRKNEIVISVNDNVFKKIKNVKIDVFLINTYLLGKGFLSRSWKGKIAYFRIYSDCYCGTYYLDVNLSSTINSQAGKNSYKIKKLENKALYDINEDALSIVEKNTLIDRKFIQIKTEDVNKGNDNLGLYIHTCYNKSKLFANNKELFKFVEKITNNKREKFFYENYYNYINEHISKLSPSLYGIKTLSDGCTKIFMEYIKNYNQKYINDFDNFAFGVGKKVADISLLPTGPIKQFTSLDEELKRRTISSGKLEKFERQLLYDSLTSNLIDYSALSFIKRNIKTINAKIASYHYCTCHNDITLNNMGLGRYNNSNMQAFFYDWGSFGLNYLGSDFSQIYIYWLNKNKIGLYIDIIIENYCRAIEEKFGVVRKHDILFCANYYALTKQINFYAHFREQRFAVTALRLCKSLEQYI